jgi:hypothetical protein
VGRQWAVTGYGIQACDQKQKSKFDIEASRLWEDDVLESMRAFQWLNTEDFEKALSVARKHFPEPPPKAIPPEEHVLGPIEAVLEEAGSKETGSKASTIEPPKPAPLTFDMRFEGWPAKFVRPWRIRISR